MITKQEITYGAFGKCLELSNGIVKLVVTLDFGPRIIRYSFVDGENMLYEDAAKEFGNFDASIAKTYGEGSAWYLYGGHRLWTSPESVPRTTYPDNDPVGYTLTDNGAVFAPPVQKCNNYGMEIAVALAEDSTDVTISHRITNYGLWPVTLAPWTVTVLSTGGTEVLPQPTVDTGLLPNRKIAFWPYAKLTDERLMLLDRYIVLRQKKMDVKFKMGINSQHGCGLYFNHGEVFVKKYEPVPGGDYPDGGVSLETYTNKAYVEMESLGEFATLATGEFTEFTESWSLAKGELPELTDEALDKAVATYVR